MKLVGFVSPTAGTYQRGASERARQWRMIQLAGGVVEYMQGPRPRVEKPLTAGAACDMIQEAEGHDKAHVSAV